MDANGWITIISSVGFPIFACCAMGFYIYKFQENIRATMDDLKEAVGNNTKMVEALLHAMHSNDNDKKD